MNCPSRTDEPGEREGWNQNPPHLAADLTTRQDLNGIANLRLQRDPLHHQTIPEEPLEMGTNKPAVHATQLGTVSAEQEKINSATKYGSQSPYPLGQNTTSRSHILGVESSRVRLWRTGQSLLKFSKFVGPGFMVAVAYIDPGNYSTDVAAGAATRFRLLFIVLMSNMFAVVLQALAIRLGTVTGLNLAENCREHLPKWLNIALYVLAEASIIATDIAEVRDCGQTAAHNLP
jgi:metal iron transporter